ncbi:MAG: hypothetical protein ABSE07_04925 [Methanoregula sp.]
MLALEFWQWRDIKSWVFGNQTIVYPLLRRGHGDLLDVRGFVRNQGGERAVRDGGKGEEEISEVMI